MLTTRYSGEQCPLTAGDRILVFENNIQIKKSDFLKMKLVKTENNEPSSIFTQLGDVL